MNPPEAYAFSTTQYYMNGQPVARFPWPHLQPWSFDGEPEALMRFAYPCRSCGAVKSSGDAADAANAEKAAEKAAKRAATKEKRDLTPANVSTAANDSADPDYACRACCPSIFDITNPANRKGGEYYNSLSDVHHYDDGNVGSSWWGSAQTCAANCGWQQGLASCQRPAFATQPVLDVRRDYASMAPFRRNVRAFGPEHTCGPLPGQPAPSPLQEEQGPQSPSYLAYYAKKDKGKAVEAAATPNFTALIKQLVAAMQKRQDLQPILQQLRQNVQQLAQTGYRDTAEMLSAFYEKTIRFAIAQQQSGAAAALLQTKTEFYDQASAVAATLMQNPASKDTWWKFVVETAAQIEQKK